MSNALAIERRKLIEDIDKRVTRLYSYGRSDRVAGLPMAFHLRFDPYYRAAYEAERRREVVPGT